MNTHRTRALALALLLAASASIGVASRQATAPQQSDKPKFEKSPEQPKSPDYSAEAYVIEKFYDKCAYEDDGTGTDETTARIRIQSQAAVQAWGVLNFGYASGTSTLQVAYVRVVKPDGRMVRTPPENVLDMPAEITRQAPFYSDLKDEQVAVKGLEIGDVLEYQYREQITKPLDPGQFWLAYNFFKSGVILSEDLEVSVPRNRQVYFKSPELQPVVSEKDDRKIYSWHNTHLKSKSEEAPEASNDEDKAPSVRITTFRDWNQIGEWFRGLAAPRAAVTPEIQAKADELTRGSKTDNDKIEALYDFVSTKFRYIGIALGIGRYQPHAAADVLTNDYGDCKDKHTLFAALLAAEHIKAFPALIHSSEKIDPDLASPDQVDHVITAIPRDKGFLFLDTTPEVAPFGFLSAGLRDKKALVVPDAGPVQLVDTPPDPPFNSFFAFEASGTLDDSGTFEAKMHLSLRGDEELLLRAAFRQSGAAQWKDVMQNVSANLGYGGTVSEVTVSSPDKTDQPFDLSYAYNRKTYGDWDNRRIVSPLPVIGLPAVPDKPGKDPIKLGSPTHFTLQGSIKVPANSRPVVPLPISLHEKFAEYESSCTFSDGVMHFTRRLTTLEREIAPAEIDSYRKFQKAVLDDYGTYIPLSASAAFGKPSDNSDAEGLFDHGRDEWQASNLTGARKDFQQAVNEDPKFAQAWLALGMADAVLGDLDASSQEIKKAGDLDPNQRTIGQTFVASYLSSRHRDDEALKWWKNVEKSDPDNIDAAKNIGAILIHQKNYADAVPELEKATQNNPLDVPLQIQLANAYIRVGKSDQAEGIFERALKGNPNASTLNSVAYELADNSLDLDQALEYAEKAVNKIEDDTTDISLDNLLEEDLRTPLDLAADWDTLGWVHFRLGHLEIAEDYLKCAWAITQDPLFADHLGQVYTKMGRTHDAAVAYARALSTTGEAPKDTNARLNALRPDGKFQHGESPDAGALQDLRSMTLRKLADGHATAEFFILFSSDSKTVDAEFVSGSEDLRYAGKVLESTKFDVSFPKSSSAKILRRGLLDCEPEAPKCMFVLIPPDSVHSIH